MTTAASAAPISGRRSRRVIGLIWATRSSPALIGGGACVPGVCAETAPDDIRLSFITSLLDVRLAVAAPWAGHQPHHLAGSLPRELLDCGRVALVNEARPGQYGLTAANRIRVLLEELQEHDRQVALQILLLVDGEHDAAALDVLDH